jgi:RNA polymerase sigma-70 factor (ECF subfamily)
MAGDDGTIQAMARPNPAAHIHGQLADKHYRAAQSQLRTARGIKGYSRALVLYNAMEQAALAADHAQYGDESLLLASVELGARAQNQALAMLGAYGPQDAPASRRLNPKKKGKKKKKQRLDTDDEGAVLKVVEKAQKGDRAAYARLYEAFRGRVYKGALRCVLAGRPRPTGGDLADAADVTQAAFLKAMDKLDKFEGKSKFYTWLYRITLNECMAWSRLMGKSASLKQAQKLKREAERGEIPSALLESFSYTVTAERVADVIRESLARLPKKQRDLIVMADMKGMRVKEIGEEQNLAKQVISDRLKVARKELQKLIHKRLAPAKEVTPEKIQKLTEEQGEDLVASLARQLEAMQADIAKLKSAGEKKKKTGNPGGDAFRRIMRL